MVPLLHDSKFVGAPSPKNDGRIRQREPIFIQALGTLRHVVRYSIPSGVAAAAI